MGSAIASRLIETGADVRVWNREPNEGTNGLIAAGAGKLFIEMSTVRPETQQQLAGAVAKAGGAFIECPVSGTTAPARSGQLVGLTGGEAADVDRARPVLAQICRWPRRSRPHSTKLRPRVGADATVHGCPRSGQPRRSLPSACPRTRRTADMSIAHDRRSHGRSQQTWLAMTGIRTRTTWRRSLPHSILCPTASAVDLPAAASPGNR